MAEYIEREAFKAEIRRLSTHYLNEWDTLGVLAAVDRIPAADVVPVRHGRWIEYPECLGYEGAYSEDHIVCSACGMVFNLLDNCTETFNYCPYCGAKQKAGDA